MTHEDYRELLAAHALTALEAADARALETHLESCADCRAEMNEWQETTALLALTAASLEPSAQLRERILASASAEGRAGSRAPEFEVDSSATIVNAGDSPFASKRESQVLPFARPRRNVWASLGSFGAIAASLIIVGLVTSLFVLWQQKRATENERARLDAEMRQARVQLDRQRAVVELLASPGAHLARLAGTNMAPGSLAMLAYDKNGHAMLMSKGLPAAPAGMAYQLWYIKDNKKMPGKVFTPDATGNGMLEDQVPAVARDAAVFAVTLEPEGGVQAPTGSIYLVSAS